MTTSISVPTTIVYSAALSVKSSEEYAIQSQNIQDIFQSDLEAVATIHDRINDLLSVTVKFTENSLRRKRRSSSTLATITAVYSVNISESTDLTLFADTVNNLAASGVTTAILNSVGTYLSRSAVATVTSVAVDSIETTTFTTTTSTVTTTAATTIKKTTSSTTITTTYTKDCPSTHPWASENGYLCCGSDGCEQNNMVCSSPPCEDNIDGTTTTTTIDITTPHHIYCPFNYPWAIGAGDICCISYGCKGDLDAQMVCPSPPCKDNIDGKASMYELTFMNNELYNFV